MHLFALEESIRRRVPALHFWSLLEDDKVGGRGAGKSINRGTHMTNINSTIQVTYTDIELHNLIEEYITLQKAGFTLKGACSYVLYWAIEDGKAAGVEGPIESNELHPSDGDRVKRTLAAIVEDGRIAFAEGDETKYDIIKR